MRSPRFARFLGSCFIVSHLAAATTYWVAPTGSDTASGTRDAPWATPHHAVAQAVAGDTIVVREGLYPFDAPLQLDRSGTAEAPITLRGYPGERPVFDGAGYLNTREAVNSGLIDIRGQSHWRLINLHVRNSHVYGFRVGDDASHVDIIECSATETYGPGIGLWNCSHLRVLHNEVTRSNTNRMRLHIDPRRGPGREAIHEAISTGGATHFEIAFNHVHHGDKEGIDIKEVSAHGRVHHNYVHHMPRQGLYADAWFGVLEDVTFEHNVVHDCEWGIGLSSEGAGAEMLDVRIRHNLFVDNHGSGVFATLWNQNGPRRGVLIAHNTFVRNGSADQFSGPTGNIDLRSSRVFDFTVVNNLCVDGGTFEIATFDDPALGGLDQLADQRIHISHNFIGSFTPMDPPPAVRVPDDSPIYARYRRAYPIPGDNPILGAPGFRDPTRGDYLLRADSVARAAGIPLGDDSAAPDLGAFPFAANDAPDAAPTVRRAMDRIWRVAFRPQPARHYQRQRSTDGGQTWHPFGATVAPYPLTDLLYLSTETIDAPPQIRYVVQPAPSS